MCIDWGSKKIGLAIGNRSLRLAVPLCVIEREPWKLAKEHLARLIKERNISEIVIGWPCNLDGSPSKRCSMISSAIDLLQSLQKPIIKHTERYSSRDACGLAGNDSAHHYAAAFILQSYLDIQDSV